MRIRLGSFKRVGVVVATATLVATIGATPASAFASDDVFFFRTADDCLWGEAKIDSAPITGIESTVNSVSTTWAVYPPFYCSWLYDRPVGWLATDIQNWRWNGVNWDLCLESGWLFNQSVSASNSYDWKLGIACGTGWYGTNGGAYVWREGQWQGGWVWSGAEYFVFNTLDEAAGVTSSAPPPPAWIRPDGTTDLLKLPAIVTVVGRDGSPTGASIDLRQFMTPPLLRLGGSSPDPVGVQRVFTTTTDRNGRTTGSEHTTLTENYRGRI